MARRIILASCAVSALTLPAMVVGAVVALTGMGDTPRIMPLTCGITWTRIGGVTWFMPDCPSQARSAPSSAKPPSLAPDAAAPQTTP